MSKNTHALDIVILSKEYAAYKAALEAYTEPTFSITQATDDPLQIEHDKVRVMLADPGLAASIVDKCDNLQWIQSGWAGDTPLIKQNKRNYVLSGKILRKNELGGKIWHNYELRSAKKNRLPHRFRRCSLPLCRIAPI